MKSEPMDEDFSEIDGDSPENGDFAGFLSDGASGAEAPEAKHKNESRLVKTKERQLYSRFSSERQLEEICEWEFEDGCAYHCLSAGDIDSTTFLRFVLRQQPLEYLLLATWCMARTDIDELRRYLRIGRIRRLDSYVADLYASSRTDEYEAMKSVHMAYGGRVAIAWNHSKVYVGFGPKFAFVIETSANMNTNRRIENTCITIDRGLALHHKAYFDAVKPCARKDDFPQWEPYEIK